MFCSVIFWSFLLFLSMTEIDGLRGGLIRNGLSPFDENIDDTISSIYVPRNPRNRLCFYVRPFQEFMRHGRRKSLSKARQSLFQSKKVTEAV